MAFIEIERSNSDVCLIAIDQPTIVPNATRSRPVDRIAGSLISFIGGGVQPANRSKIGMFDDDAPIWRFKERLGATEDPELCRTADKGLFIIEVFPALALPALNGAFYGRLRGPKYNPANKKFKKEDWYAVIDSVANYAEINDIFGIAAWARDMAEIEYPRKSDQDKLDAIICAVIGFHWRMRPREESILLGDTLSGYMVAPTSVETRERLSRKAQQIPAQIV